MTLFTIVVLADLLLYFILVREETSGWKYFFPGSGFYLLYKAMTQ